MLSRDAQDRRDTLQAYIQERGGTVRARLLMGGWTHTGNLQLPNTGFEGQFATVRDSKRGPRRQYQSVYDRHLTEEYPRLEIKIGARYVDAKEVLGL